MTEAQLAGVKRLLKDNGYAIAQIDGKPVKSAADYAKAIRGIGAAHAILSSDLGQVQNPLHPDGWVTYLAGMKKEGFTEAELRQMSGENPAKLLDLN